jgi:glycosyltransferase involved in cell wall biosynthesis
MSTPTVGLALIARDEQDQLPTLLRSIAGAFDQVVLLDTGSTDRTVHVFEAWAKRQGLPLGYAVNHFEWRDDFAAARNAADELLATDWLTWADCDDEIIDARRLRRVVKDVAATPATCITAQYIGGGMAYLRERLFRRDSGIWVWPVHECKLPDVAAWEERWCVELLPAVCHWRHRRGVRPGSNERNRRIARAWVAAEPENARALYIAAWEELVRGGEPERGIVYATAYLRLKRVRRELGSDRLARARRMLERLPLGGDPVDFVAFGLIDPLQWEARDRGRRLDHDATREVGSLTQKSGAGVHEHPAPGTGELGSGASRNLHAPLARSVPRRCLTERSRDG